MSDDTRDFHSKVDSFWSNRGHDWSPEKALGHFTLHGQEQRAAALDLLDKEFEAFEPSMENLRKATELNELRSAFRERHARLIRTGR